MMAEGYERAVQSLYNIRHMSKILDIDSLAILSLFCNDHRQGVSDADTAAIASLREDLGGAAR